MNKLRNGILTVSLFFTFFNLQSQDPEFSQFYANPVYTNPALTGSAYGRVAADYRMQYYGLPGGFVTFNLSYDQRIKKSHGLGIMFTNDVAGEGVLRANHLNVSYAYEVETKKGIVYRLGVQGGFFQKSLQWDKLHWGDQIIAQLGFVNPTNETRVDKSVTAANFGAGFLIYSKKFYAGFACHNITEPSQSFFEAGGEGSALPRRYTLHGGFVFPLTSELNKQGEPEMSVSPNVLLMSQGKFNQLNIGCYGIVNHFIFGVWFRQTTLNSDAMIGSLGMKAGKFKIGYSVDLTVSNLRSAGKTAHEITILYQFGSKKDPRIITCPSF
jgi:type IX secretion system PorP/SprF family membrane protein